MKIKAIIGLGNPGPKFYHTRHNIGFRVVDALAQELGGSWKSPNSNLEVTEVNLDGHKLHLLKPQTFMNSSGMVLPYLFKKGIEITEILVVHDELEVPFGQIKIRQGGSARGHNGLRSIISLGGEQFWRLRVGIGRPTDATPVGDFVLQNFSEGAVAVEEMVQRACAEILSLILAT